MQRATTALAALFAGAAMTMAAGGAAAQDQSSTSNAPLTPSKLAAAAPVTYDNRYELYGGINLMNFQAGPGSAQADEPGRRRGAGNFTG